MVDEESVSAWLREAVGSLAGIAAEDVQLDVRFRELGLESSQLLGLVARLSAHVGHALAATAPWEHPTPRALSRHVAQLAERAANAESAPAVDEGNKVARGDHAALLEPIAIIGMGCRLPGGASSPEAFWSLLCEGRSGIREVPIERWDVERFVDPDVAAPGKMTTRWGGFLEGVDQFDSDFFGISPREARQMDPQQRITLELAWETLEDAGLDPLGLRGDAVGVFVGAMGSDYARLTDADADAIDPYTATGTDTSIIAARVSYALGLEGTSLAVNTACSSSLVAVHLACQSLRLGETSMALAGGVQLVVSPLGTVAMTKFGAMNPAGQCRAFDASANGYVRGEGGGLVLLKPLRKALADGDRIYCVIRGSATNNDGFSNGLTAPNPHAQEAMLRKAHANAGVEPGSIHYIETHGPGTILGDPIEAGAIGAVLGPSHSRERPLHIGSAKTNIGHLEAAAGIAGLIKTALALKHRTLPPNLNFDRPNPHIPFDALHIAVQTELRGWPYPEELPRAGVSSFGFGGTNCHVVLEAAAENPALVLALAADTRAALAARVEEAQEALSRCQSWRETAALCRSLYAQFGRGSERVAVAGRGPGELAARLSALALEQRSDDGAAPRVIFVCPGYGAQWLGMARSLLAGEPVFRRELERCDRAVRKFRNWSVLEELLADESTSRLDDADVVQLLLFSVQAGLGALWRSFGIEPDAVVGHSMGEIGAAYLAGVLELDDAVRIVAERSRLASERASGRGTLLMVALSDSELAPYLAESAQRDAEPLSIGVYNSPKATVLSGSLEAIARVETQLANDGVTAHRVRIDYASHGPQMDALTAELRASLLGIAPGEARVPLFSTVRAEWLAGPDADPDYWADNLREPVRFMQAIDALSEVLGASGPCVFVEVSPHPVLLKSVEQTLTAHARRALLLASGYRNDDERGALLESLAALYRAGCDVQLDAVYDALEVRGEATREPIEELASDRGLPLPLLLSAKSARALAPQAARLAAHLRAHPEQRLRDVVYTLALGRSHFDRRAALVATKREELLEALDALSRGEPHARALLGGGKAQGKLALLFTGQGSQRAGMGRALYATFPAFRRALDEVCARFDALALPYGRPLRALIFAERGSADAALLDRTSITQPALFALEVALFRLLESFGVQPDILLGHSIGEIVAAHVAGIFSLEDGCALVAARARLMDALPSGGAMIALQAAEDEVRPLLARYEGRVDIAAINGPLSTVIAGDEEPALALAKQLEARGRKSTRLRVSHAFHSPHMAPMLEPFLEVARAISYAPPRIPIVSNVSGALARPEELTTPEYWVRHVRSAVRFADGMRTLSVLSATTFLELGPDGVLSALAVDALGDEDALFAPLLRKEASECETLAGALAALYVRGRRLAFDEVLAPIGGRRIALPTYAFQRERHWLERVQTAVPVEAGGDDALFWQAVDGADLDQVAALLALEGPADREALSRALPALASYRREQRARSAVDGLRYEVRWRRLEASALTYGESSGSLLLVGSEGERSWLEALTAALSKEGSAPIALTLSHEVATDRVALAEALRAAHGQHAVCGVLSLLALADDDAGDGMTHGLARTLVLAQALGDLGSELPLWLCTSGGVVATKGEALARPRQALTWGFGLTLALEHPERWGGLIDLGPAPQPGALAQLARALAGAEREDQLALREDGLYVRRLVRSPKRARAEEAAWAPRGTLLITGGTGALGAQLARFLAARGARSLILTSRRGVESEGALALRDELAAQGADVTIARCDVADRTALEALLAQLASRGVAIESAFHCAGVARHTPIADGRLDDVRDVLSGKVLGAENLDQLLAPEAELVLFSSVLGTVGTRHQWAYAAGNAFLAALAEQRRARGQRATSIAWGPWAGSGMAAGEEIDAALRRRGLQPLPPELGFAALAQVLAGDAAALTVADVDWKRFASSFAAGRTRGLIAELIETQAESAATPSSAAVAADTPDLLGRLRGLSEADRQRALLALVLNETAAVAGHADASRLDPGGDFVSFGLDSLMTVALRERLRKATGVRLPATLAYDHPSPAHVAAALRSALDGTLATGASQAAASPSTAQVADEPLAIVGIGLDLPGGARDLESFWKVLEGAVDTVAPIPKERWDADALYDADPESAGKSYTKSAALIEQIDLFDASFFGISPREAKRVDPQHRLLLEASWRALEDAGIVPTSLRDSRTGVFVGIGPSDYDLVQGARERADAYAILGTHTSFAAGRLAFTLGLQGPALSVDTACSSSLVALHLACQALRSGECSLALAGGVQVLAAPDMFVRLSRTRALAPDGRSKTFSDRADGYGRGEGVVVVALERLSDARENGHRVLALVRGTAVNHDGESNGITAPNGSSQQKVLRAALESAGLCAADVDVVECHGTGTSLGDPIEVQALAAVYGEARSEAQPLLLGAVKTNVGHLESAAGLAGLAKMVAALRHEALPATLHCTPRNRHIDWDGLPVQVVDRLRPWPRDGRGPRRAGVSAFGLSGTNAHVILEEAPEEALEASAAIARDEGPTLLALSAKSEAALRAQAARLAAHLREHAELALSDVAHSLVHTRATFEQRAAAVVNDRSEACAALDALAQGELHPAATQGHNSVDGKVIFVFPGQGAQWEGMASALLAQSEVFRASVEACERALAPYVEWSLGDVLRGAPGAPDFGRVDVVQPALWAVMVSLAALWKHYGVEPDAVIGHSQGEIAAAVVAGTLSLEDGARAVALRARAIMKLAGKGGMLSVELSEAELQPYMQPFGDRVAVATINGPRSTVLSGDGETLQLLLEALRAAQVFARLIRVDYASHSHHVEAIEQEVLEALAPIQPRSGAIPFYSSVHVARLDGPELDARYWYQNARQPVRFAPAIDQVVAEGHRFFVEVSPHPVLGIALEANLEPLAGRAAVVGTLRREQGELRRFVLSLAELTTRGLRVDWTKVLPPGRRVALPTYAFQRARFWVETQPGSPNRGASGQSALGHGLLSAVVPLADSDAFLFTGTLSLTQQPWLQGHVVLGRVVVPGTGIVELTLRAAQHVGLASVEELLLEAPLVLAEQETLALQLSLSAADDAGRRSFVLHARRDDAEASRWTRHAKGMLAPAAERSAGELAIFPPRAAAPVEIGDVYERLADIGLEYGGQFRGLRALWRRGEELFAEVSLEQDEESERDGADGFALHPALLDAALHPLALAALTQPGSMPLMPFAFAGVQVVRRSVRALRVHIAPRADESAVTVTLADHDGAPVAVIDSLSLRPASRELLTRGAPAPLYRLQWSAASGGESALPARCALVGADVLAIAEIERARFVHYPSLAELSAAVAAGEPLPELVVATAASDLTCASDPHVATRAVLALTQAWLGDERLHGARFALVTRRAIAIDDQEPALDLAYAPIWGLVRSAQTEHGAQAPQLLDTDDSAASRDALLAALMSGEKQIALRAGARLVPRLATTASAPTLELPRQGAWKLAIGKSGSLEEIAIAPQPELAAPAAHEVRIAMRAAGVNFRDVLIALGMYPDPSTPLGAEGAGVVVALGSEVRDLRVGDRVLGSIRGAFAPEVNVDARMVAPIPTSWSFAQAAAVPAVYLTAYYALVHLAGLKRGERVLIHAAAGGVGTAAVQIARHLGAEVFGTASLGKWEALRALGLDDAHIASSRTLDFAAQFTATTSGAGVDVVLNSLAREFVDASLGLMPRGGRFLEMGKTDIREPARIAREHPGVVYRALDLTEAEPALVQQMLRELLALFREGVLALPPTRTWDIRQARDAFRYLGQARNVGKLVLTLPRPLAPEGTVLITGGTGTLAALIARHLVAAHGVRHLLLASRSGARSAQAQALREELTAAGATVAIVACDTSDRSALEALLASIPGEHPLTAVVHMAGVLADGVVTQQSDERLALAMRPKVDAALHLDALTRELDLSAFVLFSSAAGVLGTAGQSNYAAANTFLDALAGARRARGQAATSLAWGYWADRSGLTAHLSAADLARMERAGIGALSAEEGLAAFDEALRRPESLLVPMRVEKSALRRTELPPLFALLAQTRRESKRSESAPALREQLASLTESERSRRVAELVCREVATVLGHTSAADVDRARPLQEVGLDSLMAVELRNRLAAASGLRMPATLLFDHPTPLSLAQRLERDLLGSRASTTQVTRAAIAPRADDDPIAIVSLSCRLPNGIETPEQFWQLLAAGEDAITPFPSDRGWNLEALYDPDPDVKGKSYVREGGFLRDAGNFDPAFFGISPREALAIDPQQRLLLETSWEALERAGIDASSLAGSPTGVFVGVIYDDYGEVLQQTSDEHEGYANVGSAASVASGRISYTFGFEGPAVSVDTACSSSLVALHLACQALRQGECTLALAGGVTVYASPSMFIEFSRQRGLAPDGRAKPFSADADGANWAEGVGMIVLERLSDAKANGHPVLAVIRGSAVNQDGRSQGLTAPNGPAQQRVIQKALASAQLTADEVDAVEAHGTGTVLGDPIEAEALIATYGKERTQPLWLGTVKSNLGHTQAAAGVTGVIKMVLALQHEHLPATLRAARPSPHIDWSAGNVQLLNAGRAWPAGERPRRAAVSSFGISGTNAHLILEEAPTSSSEAASSESAAPAMLWLSGKSEPALRAQAERLAVHLRARPELSLGDVAYSLVSSRATFDRRAALVVNDRSEALEALAALARDETHPAVVRGHKAVDGKVVFVFPGQGAQWEQMAVALLSQSEVFRSSIAACERALTPFVDWSLHAVLRGAEGAPAFDRVDVVQPALWAMMVSLAALFRHHGIEPDAVVGHSQGEIAAAVVAGALSLEDGARVVALRSRAILALAGKGGMLAVEREASELQPYLAPFGARVSVAAINSPRATVVSGEPEALEQLLEVLGAAQVFARMIRVDYASHSQQVEAVEREILDALAPIRPKRGAVPLYSSVHVARLEGGELDASYWYTNLRQTVRFAEAVARLAEDEHRFFVEISPHPVLGIALEANLEPLAARAAVAGTLRRDQGDLRRFLLSIGELGTRGLALDWSKVVPPGRRGALPTYPFQRERFWGVGGKRKQADLLAAGLGATDHPLLGAAIPLAESDALLLTGRLSLEEQPWLAEHRVFGRVVLPGVAYLELAHSAALRVGLDAVEELTLEAPLVVPERGTVQVQLSLASPDHSGRRSFALHARAGGDDAPWARHASGTLGSAPPAAQLNDLSAWPPAAARALPLADFYQRFASSGVSYGPAFQGLTAAWARGDELFAEVQQPATLEDEGGFAAHPALLDAALHVLTLSPNFEASEGPLLPFAFTGFALHATGATSLRVRVAPSQSGSGVSLTLADARGGLVATLDSLALRPATAPVEGERAAVARSLYRVQWNARPIDLAPPPLQPLALLGGALDALARVLPDAVAYDDLAALTAALDGGAALPEVVVVDCTPSAEGELAQRVHARTQWAVSLLQRWLGDERFAATQLVLLTHGAIAVPLDTSTGGERVDDLAHAGLWGLVRTAQAEHRDRALVIIDVDAHPASLRALPQAIACGEPQVALREGAVRVPRLVRVKASAGRVSFSPNGTVLITGGTGTIGARIARHLVEAHGVRQLLLTSRAGAEAASARALHAELTALGAQVSFAACDASERDALAAALAAIPAAHPLCAVIHAAGVLDDGVLTALTPERLARVLRPKVDGAIHLDALTRTLPLDAFVLFSSTAGVLGGMGQANYAAANTFVDALAQQRRAEGRATSSLAWGFWAERTGLTAHLGEADLERMGRFGLRAMESATGVALFDLALAQSDALLVPATFDPALLAANDALPSVLRSLAPAQRRRASNKAEGNSLGERLRTLDEAERERVLLELVRKEIADVLRLADPSAAPPDRALKELGLDSLMALELRNRLSAATGLRMPATLLFDHPTPLALSARLRRDLLGELASTALAPRATSARSGEAEPIAIVAMSCRLPGGAHSPEALWELLARGGDAVTPFPEDRGWPLDELYDPDPDARGKSYVREGGFLHEAALFDAEFFEISPREAVTIDPQQRLLLETSWEALERAGIDARSLSGSRTGVFVGVMYQDYASDVLQRSADHEGHAGIGSLGSVASGRIAYTLGLEGPAVSVDTACSSSLVALHLACQALRQGECTLALAGGVTVMSTPQLFIDMSRQRGLAPDGRCKPFSADADGTTWSEGAGILVLERLSDAQRNGHPVLAIVRGSAVNQDGKSQGLTAPNGPAQERVIRQALESARLTPSDVDAVEAHGTGTVLGDPIEAQALLATYGHEREEPLWLGTIKSNLGHTQAAAGVTGVIKLVLALAHEQLPKTLRAEQPTPHVDWSAGNVQLLHEARPWPVRERPRRAAVSAFGISGTNAHVIIEEPPANTRPAAATTQADVRISAPTPLLLTARSESALRAQAERLAQQLRSQPELALSDVAHSLLTTRARFEQRAALVVNDRSDAIETLTRLARGEQVESATLGRADVDGKLAFVFPGQGAQWEAMAVALLETNAVFRAEIEACAAALAPFVDWSLLAVLRRDPGAPAFDRVDVVQPASWAVMVALAALWRSLGVLPAAVVGHSQGEIAAAVVAGALSLEDGARVVALRSRAITQIAGKGGMMAVELREPEVRVHMAPWRDRLSVAAINSPRSTVVCGDPDALAELLAALTEAQVFARLIRVDYASHSAHVEAIEAAILEALAPIAPRAGTVPLYSSVEVARLDGTQLDARYWYRNLRQTVRFSEAIAELAADGHRYFVEVSPHPVLAIALEANLESTPAATVVVGTLRRDEGDLARVQRSAGELATRGLALDWSTLVRGERVALPTYPFQRTRYWGGPTQRTSGDVRAAGLSRAEHPLLGAALTLADSDTLVFTGRLSLDSHPWLADHAVFESALLPGTAYLELALTAAERVGLDLVEELTLAAPLLLPEKGAVQLQLSVGPADDDGRRPIALYARAEGDEGAFTRHATGQLARRKEPLPAYGALTAWPPTGAEPLAVADVYDRLAGFGLHYGAAFQGLIAGYARGDDLFAEVVLPSAQHEEAARFALHPALLDAAIHVFAIESLGQGGALSLPFSWANVSLGQRGATALRVHLGRGEQREQLSLEIADDSGAIVLRADRLLVRAAQRELLRGASTGAALYRLSYRESALPSAEERTRDLRWAVLGRDEAGITSLLEAQLASAGCQCADFASLRALLDTGVPVPALVVVPLARAAANGGPASCDGEQALVESSAALVLLQEWLRDERLAEARLVFLSERALAASPDEDVLDLAHAPLLGLLRSARAEHPERRFASLDIDSHADSLAALARALVAEEPELALRRGIALTPALTRFTPAEPRGPSALRGTVLVTGGTGTLGALVARHLVRAHGVKHLLLTSRSGGRAQGAAALRDELLRLGAETVVLAACDVAQRASLVTLLATIPREQPLCAVFHTAGMLDDGVLSALSPAQLAHVFAPKVAAALHLHELTSSSQLSAFVLFSSLAGVLGSAGQANYAAANGFVDALAQRRAALGLPAVSLAWGFWRERSGLTTHLADADVARLARSGVVPLDSEEALHLLDAALSAGTANLAPANLDVRELAAQGERLHPLLRGLVPRPARATSAPISARVPLKQRLAEAPEAARERLVLDLVRGEIAAVLRLSSPRSAPLDRSLKELGLDSLMALDLRNRLSAASGLRLPATLLFDHPTAAALARYLREQCAVGDVAGEAPLFVELDRLEALFSAQLPSGSARERAQRRLAALLEKVAEPEPKESGSAIDKLASATAEELFSLLDGALGSE